MSRSAPAGGYTRGNKKQYRRGVWAFARDYFGSWDLSSKRALLLPSTEGAEVEVAVAAGFREPNLVLCDENPAIVATLRRRFPRVTTRGVPLAEACRREAAAGRPLDVINADLCSPIGRVLLTELDGIIQSGVLRPGGLLFITVLRGREVGIPVDSETLQLRKPADVPGYEALTTTWDAFRLAVLTLAASGLLTWNSAGGGRYRAHPGRPNVYASGPQTMLWVPFAMHPWDGYATCGHCQRFPAFARGLVALVEEQMALPGILARLSSRPEEAS